jgi:catechol 2,3-dioxygenase-like lactoylglutathione lyase family enzyme
MLQSAYTFSSFSVKDLARAKKFYSEKLGLKVSQDKMGLQLSTSGNNPIFVYAKLDHVPASYTILNFVVDDIDQAVAGLRQKGVVFEEYDFGFAKTNKNGIMRGLAAKQGPDIAWFKDPDGNTLAILQNE